MTAETRLAQLVKAQVRRFPEGSGKRCGTVGRIARPNVSPCVCLVIDTRGRGTHGPLRRIGGVR
jgi:hypothetical protein